MNNKLLLLIAVILLLVSPALAGTDTISIYGTNASNAQTNMTKTGNESVNVSVWAVNGIKTFYINVTNTSDTLTLNIYNNTVGQIDEIIINGVSINGLQVDGSGLLAFNRTQAKSNYTWTVRPALQSGGFNWTWGWFQNLWVVNQTTINNVIITNTTTLIATNINGSGAGISNLNASNLTTGIVPAAVLPATIYTILNITQNYTIANNSMTLFNVSAFTGTLNMTLPTMTGSGKIYTITKTDASSNNVQINVTGNCCIDGVAWANITSQYTSIDVVDINSMWKII